MGPLPGPWTADISPSLRSLSGGGRLSDWSFLKLRVQDAPFCLLAKKFQGERSFQQKGCYEESSAPRMKRDPEDVCVTILGYW